MKSEEAHSKPLTKMNKKELIEKIKQLEEEKEIIREREINLGGFVCSLNLFDIFIDSLNNEIVNLTDAKKAINDVQGSQLVKLSLN